MGHKTQKAFVVLITLGIFIFSVSQVYAQGLGIDFVTLVKNKIAIFVSANTSVVPASMANSREQTEQDILNYTDEYITGLDNEIREYTKEQLKEADGNMKITYGDVKGQLDSVREELMNGAKEQVKQIIDEKYQEEQAKLNNEVKTKIEDKFR